MLLRAVAQASGLSVRYILLSWRDFICCTQLSHKSGLAAEAWLVTPRAASQSDII